MRSLAFCKIVSSLALVLLASGCSTAWSKKDKEQLTAVSVAPTSVAKDAYQKPDATNSPGMNEAIPRATMGGLIPSLIGSAIDASVMAKQQKKFEETNLQYFDALQKAMATPPAAAVTAALKQGLGQHDFFRTRMVEQSTTTFTAEILHYGLQKASPASATDNLLRVRIIARITLKLPDGTTMFECLATGLSADSKTAADILASPDFIAKGTEDAAKEVAFQVGYKVDAKIRR